MRFVLDESSFALDGLGESAIEESLSDLLELMTHCRRSKELIGRFSEIYRALIGPSLEVHDLLFAEPMRVALPRDLRLAVAVAIDRCVIWDLSDTDVSELEARVDDGPLLFAPSIVFVHRSVGERKGRSCLVLRYSGRSGERTVEVAGVSQPLHFVGTPDDTAHFYRSIFELENASERQYMELAPLAFPGLTFADGLDRQFRRFSRPYPSIRQEVTRHLAALNDHWPAAFQGNPTPDEVARRMRALANVDASPESPNTRANRSARAQRRILLRGREVYCEWHMKLSPTTDRIHFHPGDPMIDRGPIVGIFIDHLVT
jgi:hypothetical protein